MLLAVIAISNDTESWIIKFDKASLACVYVKLEQLLDDGVINADTCDYLSYEAGQLAAELETI